MSSGIIMGNVTINEHVHYIRGNVIFSTGEENGTANYKYNIDTDEITYSGKLLTGSIIFSDFIDDLNECIRHKYLSTYVHAQEE